MERLVWIWVGSGATGAGTGLVAAWKSGNASRGLWAVLVLLIGAAVGVGAFAAFLQEFDHHWGWIAFIMASSVFALSAIPTGAFAYLASAQRRLAMRPGASCAAFLLCSIVPFGFAHVVSTLSGVALGGDFGLGFYIVLVAGGFFALVGNAGFALFTLYRAVRPKLRSDPIVSAQTKAGP